MGRAFLKIYFGENDDARTKFRTKCVTTHPGGNLNSFVVCKIAGGCSGGLLKHLYFGESYARIQMKN